MLDHELSLRGYRIAVVSRCSWTLFNFRRGLMRFLQEKGAEVLALGAGGDGFDEKLVAEGFRFRSVPVSRRALAPIADIALVFRLIRIFRESRPDVVHAFTIKPAIYATLAAALAGVRVRVVTITGLGHAFTTASWPLRFIVKLLYRIALRFTNIVVFQNSDDRDLFLSNALTSSDRTRLVAGSGVDLTKFTVTPLPMNPQRSLQVLMIARLLKEKGVLEYAEAARIVCERRPGTRFVLLGGLDARNPSSLTMEQLTLLRTSKYVECVDEVSDVRPHIAAADIVVLPSYREGLPRSLLEAAAMGRPLVATDVPGCRQVVVSGRNGYLVPSMDAVALADAIERLIVDPQSREKMGTFSRQMVEEQFDERGVLRDTVETYLAELKRTG